MRPALTVVIAIAMIMGLPVLAHFQLWGVLVAVTFFLLVGLVIWHTGQFGYSCAACGHRFTVSMLRNLVSPHIPTETGGEKRLRCPSCGEVSWARIVDREAVDRLDH